MWLKNPLIQRAVNVQAHYVFGQGINIRARAPAVNTVVQQFLDDPRNQVELTGHQAQEMKERELALLSNVFFVFFVTRATGEVVVRSIPPDEVDEIITNPEDAKESWFYRRSWTESRVDLDSGTPNIIMRTAYYPDWHYGPRAKPRTIGGHEVRWDAPAYHVKVNCLSDMQFGVSEVYSALDWARAYKEFLEDWATIVRAYSRFAWHQTVPGGKAGISAAKAKLGTSISSSMGLETNPPPVTGSTFISGAGVHLEPLRTAGATTSAEDGRRILLMVAAAVGLPESFFGDVSVGTLATAKSLDRPTELKMISRQAFWADVYKAILTYVVLAAARAGRIPGARVVTTPNGGAKVILPPDPETGQEQDTAVDVDFPSILEHDVATRVQAIVQAGTLSGQAQAGVIAQPTLSRLLLTALGEDDVDALLDKLYPEDGTAAPTAQPQAEALMVEAVRELHEALTTFAGKYGNRN